LILAVDLKTRPNIIPWPPLIFAMACVSGFVLHHIAPIDVLLPRVIVLGGGVVIALGLGLDVWAMATMMQARTNILPNRAAGRLVTRGPFAISRNPIYLGNTVLMFGIGLAFNVLWFLPLAICAAALVERLAIRREETHLAFLFGPEWVAYAKTTARWLKWPFWARAFPE
jgi:protein-S-isoprenylcysteine O-methyltransferase Ste14